MMSKNYGDSNPEVAEFYNELRKKRLEHINKRIRKKMFLLENMRMMNQFRISVNLQSKDHLHD